MTLYKKLFSYMPERKFHGLLAVILSAFGIVLEFYAYYLIWILLKKRFYWTRFEKLSKFSY